MSWYKSTELALAFLEWPSFFAHKIERSTSQLLPLWRNSVVFILPGHPFFASKIRRFLMRSLPKKLPKMVPTSKITFYLHFSRIAVKYQSIFNFWNLWFQNLVWNRLSKNINWQKQKKSPGRAFYVNIDVFGTRFTRMDIHFFHEKLKYLHSACYQNRKTIID